MTDKEKIKKVSKLFDELERDLSALTNLPVLCSLPHLTKFNLANFSEMIASQVDISTLIN